MNEDTYATTDHLMIQALLMCGYEVKDIKEDNRGQLVYFFNNCDVKQTVSMILSGKGDEIKFTLTQWWKAMNTWQMALRHKDRKNDVLANER